MTKLSNIEKECLQNVLYIYYMLYLSKYSTIIIYNLYTIYSYTNEKFLFVWFIIKSFFLM